MNHDVLNGDISNCKCACVTERLFGSIIHLLSVFTCFVDISTHLCLLPLSFSLVQYGNNLFRFIFLSSVLCTRYSNTGYRMHLGSKQPGKVQ